MIGEEEYVGLRCREEKEGSRRMASIKNDLQRRYYQVKRLLRDDCSVTVTPRNSLKRNRMVLKMFPLYRTR